jgi:hypothetical protein
MSRPPREKWEPSSKTRFLVGAATVLLLALFVFSNTNGDLTVAGDDRWMISHQLRFSWNFYKLIDRGFLMPFYTLLYDVSGRNTQHVHLFFFTLMISSALLLYAVLHKSLGAAPGALGAIFYQGYCGTHEVVDWIAAGGYTICLNILFLSAWIALSNRLGPWTKGALIAGLNWLGALFYEVLIVAAPLYPLLYWLHHRLRRKPMDRSAFAATFLPLLTFLFNIVFLYFSTAKDAPLPWQRGSTRAGMGLATALARLWPTFTGGVSAGFGQAHYVLLQHEAGNFFGAAPVPLYAILAALGICAGIVFLLWTSPRVLCDRSIVTPLLIAGVYLALFSPLVGFTTNPGFVPSRLLTLVDVGLALLVAAAVAWAIAQRSPILRYAIPTAMLALGATEAAAMNSILYEQQTSWTYDAHIRSQLLASGIQPHSGDSIFISLPSRPSDSRWKIGFSQFEGGHIEWILTADFGLLVEHAPDTALHYLHEIRTPGTPPAKPAPSPGHELFCFTVSDRDYRLARTACP